MLGLGNTLSGGIVPAAGATPLTNEKSLLFDGSNDYMEADGGTAMNLDGEFTYAFWFKLTEPSGSGTNAQMPIMFSSGGALNFYITTDFSTPRNNIPQVNSPIGNITSVSNPVLSDEEWHFVCVTHDIESGVASEVKYYLDGALEGTRSATVTYTAITGQDFKIGRYDRDDGGYTSLYFGGHMDEISIWTDKVLTAAEVSSLYNSGTPVDLKTDQDDYGSSSSLAHWWRMGDGDTYPSIEDNVGSYDFTMTNMTSGDIVTEVPS